VSEFVVSRDADYLGGGGGPSAAMQWQFPASKVSVHVLQVIVVVGGGEGGGFQGGGGVRPLLPLRVPPTAAPVSPGDAFDGAAAASTMKQRQFGFDGRQQYAAAEQHGHREQGVDSYGVAAPHHFPSPSPRHAVQFSQANPSTLRGSVDERFPVFVLLAVSAVPEADGGRRRVRLPAGSPRRGGRRRQEAHRLPRQTGMIRAIIQCMPRKQNHGKTRL
jgi:hypothetical protein